MARIRRTVHSRFTVVEDLEVHTSTIKAAGVTLLEIRNYVPSTKQYGRGITVPHARLDDVHRGIHDIQRATSPVQVEAAP